MIQLDRVRFIYDEMEMAFTLNVGRGSFVAVTGPSGAGKSTLLALIAGFEPPLSGTITLDGRDMAGVAPERRPVSIIFQDYNTFAHLDLWKNVALGISPTLKLDAPERARVDEALNQVELGPLANRLPGDISGGERQRVAIARALVRDRPILLLDEAFASLGPAMRRDMLDLVRSLHNERGLTVLMVTHHPEDVRYAADTVVFVHGGRVLAVEPTFRFFAMRDRPEIAEYLGDWSAAR